MELKGCLKANWGRVCVPLLGVSCESWRSSDDFKQGREFGFASGKETDCNLEKDWCLGWWGVVEGYKEVAGVVHSKKC